MIALSRSDVASVAHITGNQLEHLIKERVLLPDEGEVRKRFSTSETSLAIIAGCLIENGVKPGLLVEPINWLRNTLNRPIPITPEDAKPRCYAERFAKIYSENIENEEFRRVTIDMVAGSLAGVEHSNDIFEADFLPDKFLEELPDIIGDKAEQYIEDVRDEAKTMLENPIGWDLDLIQEIEHSVKLNAAIEGKRNHYFQLSIDDNGNWKTLLSDEAMPLKDSFTWLTVDIRRLFKARPVTG